MVKRGFFCRRLFGIAKPKVTKNSFVNKKFTKIFSKTLDKTRNK